MRPPREPGMPGRARLRPMEKGGGGARSTGWAGLAAARRGAAGGAGPGGAMATGVAVRAGRL